MNIREAKKLDNLKLANLIREVFDEYNAPKDGTVYSDPTTDDLYKLFRTEQSILWVAEIKDEIAGCCGLYPTPGLPKNCAELVKFYISSKFRGKGIGKSLLEKCIKSAKKMGYTQIYIESLSEFSNAIRIYEKQGFIKLEHPLGDSGHTTCNIWMLKNI